MELLVGWELVFLYIFFYLLRSALLNKHKKKIHFSQFLFFLRIDKTPGMEFN